VKRTQILDREGLRPPDVTERGRKDSDARGGGEKKGLKEESQREGMARGGDAKCQRSQALVNERCGKRDKTSGERTGDTEEISGWWVKALW